MPDKELEKEVVEQKDKAQEELNTLTQDTEQKSKDLAQEQYDTDPTKLYKDYNANQAKGEGQFGMINNRDYGTTLRLAREADRYNAAPRAHIYDVGTNNTGGIRDMGVGYDKPKLETMETRAMDEAFDLDENQKKLAQELQDAVRRKDLEAFKDLYKQLFNIELDRMQAKMEMAKWSRQQMASNALQKNLYAFQQYLLRNLNLETAQILMGMVSSGNGIGAQLAASIMGGFATPAQSQLFEQQARNELIDYYRSQNYSDYQANQKADYELAKIDLQNFNKTEAMTKKQQNVFNKAKAWGDAK